MIWWIFAYGSGSNQYSQLSSLEYQLPYSFLWNTPPIYCFLCQCDAEFGMENSFVLFFTKAFSYNSRMFPMHFQSYFSPLLQAILLLFEKYVYHHQDGMPVHKDLNVKNGLKFDKTWNDLKCAQILPTKSFDFELTRSASKTGL